MLLFTLSDLSVSLCHGLLIHLFTSSSFSCNDYLILPCCKLAVDAILVDIPFKCRRHRAQFILHIKIYKFPLVLSFHFIKGWILLEHQEGSAHSILYFGLSGQCNILHQGVELDDDDMVLRLLILVFKFLSGDGCLVMIVRQWMV